MDQNELLQNIGQLYSEIKRAQHFINQLTTQNQEYEQAISTLKTENEALQNSLKEMSKKALENKERD